MTVLALGSAKASPGVTTAGIALAAAWPADRRIVVVEADTDGGILAARYQMTAEPGLSTLAVAGRRSIRPDDLAAHMQEIPGSDVHAILAPPVAEQARRSLSLAAAPLARTLPQLESTDVIVDVGRLRPDMEAAPLLDAADAVLIVVRPRLEELQQLPARIRALRRGAARVGLLLVGERPYPAAEVAVALEAEVVAVLAVDHAGADALAGRASTSALARSALMRSVRGAVEAIRAWAPHPTVGSAGGHLAVPVGTPGDPVLDVGSAR